MGGRASFVVGGFFAFDFGPFVVACHVAEEELSVGRWPRMEERGRVGMEP